ncbi:MAG: tRNA dihydrouridine synthase DusB [Peptococcaceae bacterium]|nr:tRNA dihydrouridine synthase DusB [Peptococcaceae bacterium]
MAGVTDKAYRQLIRELCENDSCIRVHTMTEMVSCQALHFHNKLTLAMLDLEGEPVPRTVQIFGRDPSLMAEGAKRLVSMGATAININMGCPVPKIVNNGEGAALLKNLPLATEIAGAVVDAVGGVGTGSACVPVSVKTRLGWDEEHIVISELALRLEQAGVAELMVHGRTRSQFYGGRADWSWLARVKAVAGIPVIGNGDIQIPEDAVRLVEETGCDGVMIGRGMLGNPWVVARTAMLLQNGVLTPEVTAAERLRVAHRHFELLVQYKGEAVAVKEMRKHALWYTKGVRGAARLRQRMSQIQSVEAFAGLMEEAFK